LIYEFESEVWMRRGPTAAAGAVIVARKERKTVRQSDSAAARGTLRREAVEDTLRSPGRPLDEATREVMGARFGRDFSRVRVHTDGRAAASAQAVDARAYTMGDHIAFGAGQYEPARPEGQELLAHELTHVAQQQGVATGPTTRIARPGGHAEREAEPAARAVVAGRSPGPVTALAQPALQRKEIRGAGATPGTGEGADLIFIIRAPDDQFTNDVTQYVETVLEGQTFIEVDNLDDIFDHLARLKARVNAFEVLEPAIKVRRIRIVAHGSTTGGVKMTPRGETARRWVTPQEVAAYAQNSLAQATLAQVMAPSAQIEFWGCNIGAVPAAGEAWSQAFGAEFSATSETFKTGFDEFVRPADKGETGEKVPGHGGTWVRVTSTSEIDSRSRGLQASFRKWLLTRYAEFVANGDILPIDNKAERLAYMRDLFDRSGGQIRHILIEQKSDQQKIRPGNQKVWLKLWKTTAPTP
jgi:hypothetical protein